MIYILVDSGPKNDSNKAIRGAYTSIESLSAGVDYYIKEYPENVFSYESWEENYILEPDGWDWCYIPIGTDTSDLDAGGGMVPNRKLFGKNITMGGWSEQ